MNNNDSKKTKISFCIFLFFCFTSLVYSLTTYTIVEEDIIKIQPAAIDLDQDKIFFYYSPPFNESGEWQTTLDDAGTYHTKITASDGKSRTEEEITIIVQNKNQPPEIEDRKIIVEETEIIDLKLLISDPDDDALKLIVPEPFDQEGIWQTTNDDAGTYQIKITASDLEFKTTKEIEIEIKDKNRPPEIFSSFSLSKLVSLTEDTTFYFSVSVRDLDSDHLTYSWQLDAKEISSNPSFSYYFDFETFGKHKLVLTASDQRSETKKTWVIKIEDVNRPPELDISDIIIDEEEKIILQLPEQDADGDLITYTFQPPFQNGTWQTTLDDSGTYHTLITASDGDLTTRKEIKVIVKNVDRAPIINLDEKITINENERLRLDLEEFITDPDNDDLTITIKNLPTDASLNDNKLRWQPSYEFIQRRSNFFTDFLNRLKIEQFFFPQSKKVELEINVCGAELCADHDLEIQVNNLNRKPVLEEMGIITVTETETVFLELKATDPDTDHVRYSFEEPFNSDGEWQTTIDDQGKFTTVVTVSDGYLTNTQEVEIIVLNKNRPPTLEIEKDYFKLNENQLLSLKVTATDPDNDNLTIFAKDLPDGASFKDEVFSWTPSFDTVTERKPSFLNNFYAKSSFLNQRFNKEYEQFVIEFIASDGEFDVIHPVLITVKNVDRSPEVVDYFPAKRLITTTREPVIFFVNVSDPDKENLTYQWSFGFWEESIEGPNKLKRTFTTPGIKTITVKASDGTYQTEHEWKVKVNPRTSKSAQTQLESTQTQPIQTQLSS